MPERSMSWYLHVGRKDESVLVCATMGEDQLLPGHAYDFICGIAIDERVVYFPLASRGQGQVPEGMLHPTRSGTWTNGATPFAGIRPHDMRTCSRKIRNQQATN